MAVDSEGHPALVLLALDPADFPSLHQARQVLMPARKHPENPVLRPRPGQWDGTRCKVYGTVLIDPADGLFKMWYSGSADTPDAIRRESGASRHVGYACSHDGIHWQRPALGLCDYNGSKENNIVQLDAQAPSVFLRHEPSDPARRFLMITEAGQQTNLNRILYSGDGHRWIASDTQPIDSGDWGVKTHEPFSILYDPLDPDPGRQWKGYSLLHLTRDGYRGRAVGLFLGSDPEHWNEYSRQPIFSASDGLESEIHIAHVTRFHQTYVMLYDAMEPNHHTQTEVAVSDDGIHFRRVQNGVKLIPNGRPGDVDGGCVCVSPRSLFVHQGKIWWYYTVSPDTYQTGPRSFYPRPWYRYTALAQWREDGLACIAPVEGAGQATVTSGLLEVGAAGLGTLWLNAVGDDIVVHALDDADNVLATSKPWSGDELRGHVTWTSRPAAGPGRQIRLRIRLRGENAKLFAVGAPGLSRAPRPAMTRRPRPPRTVRWIFSADAKISAAPVVDDEMVYFGSWDQNVYAVEAATGKPCWKFATGNAITTSPAIHGGVVYSASHDGHVYAIERDSGHLLWKRRLRHDDATPDPNPNHLWIDCSPVVGAWTCASADEKTPPKRLFIGAHDRQMHALDVETGAEVWHFPTFNWILGRPTVEDYIVYFGSMDGRMYAVDARCGALHWIYEAGKYLAFGPAVVPGSAGGEGVCSSPLVADSTVYAGADDGHLYALDRAGGREKWVFRTGKWIWGRPLLSRGMLVVASADGGVYGVDKETGDSVWKHESGNTYYTDVVSWDQHALVASTSGRLDAFDPSNGRIAGTFNAGTAVRATPTVGADGLIYLATCAGQVYALALE